MWKYECITRTEFEKRKDFVEGLLVRLGANPINIKLCDKITNISMQRYDSIVSQRQVYQYKDEFFRVDEVLFPEKPFIVIEWTDRLEYVLNNMMEDADPFPYDLTDEEIVEEMKAMLE